MPVGYPDPACEVAYLCSVFILRQQIWHLERKKKFAYKITASTDSGVASDSVYLYQTLILDEGLVWLLMRDPHTQKTWLPKKWVPFWSSINFKEDNMQKNGISYKEDLMQKKNVPVQILY